MVFETQRSETPQTPADPWDAPYFGGTVYLQYQPTLRVMGAPVARAAEAEEEAMAMGAVARVEPFLYPWDAPYFGAPVFLLYRPTLAGVGAQPAVAAMTLTLGELEMGEPGARAGMAATGATEALQQGGAEMREREGALVVAGGERVTMPQPRRRGLFTWLFGRGA